MKSNINTTHTRSELVNKIIDDLIASQELEKEIISNTEYMLWLENFTTKNPCWSDDTWTYCREEISEEDYKRVEELHLLFSAIDNYAKCNFISVQYDEFGTYYYIKFNALIYKIGQMIGQGCLTYCEKVSISSENTLIEFNDIMTNKKQENVDDVNQKLDSMCKIIEELIKFGVPSKIILSRVEDVLENKSES